MFYLAPNFVLKYNIITHNLKVYFIKLNSSLERPRSQAIEKALACGKREFPKLTSRTFEIKYYTRKARETDKNGRNGLK